jgi:hypothetical protein
VHLKYSKTKAEAEEVERQHNETNWLNAVKAASETNSKPEASETTSEPKASETTSEPKASEPKGDGDDDTAGRKAAEEGAAMSPTNFHTNMRRTNRKPQYKKVVIKRFKAFKAPRQPMRPASPCAYQGSLVLLTNANGNGTPEGNGNC